MPAHVRTLIVPMLQAIHGDLPGARPTAQPPALTSNRRSCTGGRRAGLPGTRRHSSQQHTQQWHQLHPAARPASGGVRQLQLAKLLPPGGIVLH
jgi:hypothetical protein